MNEGDKLVLGFGTKGLIGRVVDDEEMPTDKEGKPFEALVNPLTVITRRNPNQIIEAVLGKIAAKTGKPYSVPSFSDENSVEDMVNFAKKEMAKHDVSDKEDVIDPVTGRTIPGVLTGVNYFMKLHHLAESKQSGRGFGSYGADDAPAKVGGAIGSAKKFSLADAQAALAHGAHNFVRDTKMIRSQRNQDYWSEFMAGKSPLEPRVSEHHNRFLNLLRAGGLNPVKQGEKLKLGVLTDKDVLERAGDREIQNGDTVNWDDGLSPVKGGLFDPGLTGGHGSKTRWAKITLPEPVPNPGFEDPIRWTLGITEKKMRDVLAGREELNGRKGPAALAQALEDIDIDKEIERTKAQWKARRGVGKDQAARKWSTLARAKEQGLHPRDWMLSVVPVLPPAYRPVSVMQDTGRPMVADANLLYKDLLDTSTAMKELAGHTADLGEERLAVYDAVKAVTGLGEPISPKNRERGVKGVLKTVFGNAGPKYSAIQKSLLGGTVDTVGQGVVVPDPELGMDEVGIPEDLAWETYRPFVVRRLVRGNVPGPRAYKMVEDRDDRAKSALLQEMDSRPVVMRRAPVLHKYGEMGFFPKLVKGKQIRVTPTVTAGFGMDFDGDSVAFHVPSTDSSIRDVIERMLPSKNLLSVRTGKVHQFMVVMGVMVVMLPTVSGVIFSNWQFLG